MNRSVPVKHEIVGHGKRIAERIQRFLAKWLRGEYRTLAAGQPAEGLLGMFPGA